jgi:hypothetical protein
LFFKSHYLSISAGNTEVMIKSISGKEYVIKMITSVLEVSEQVSISKSESIGKFDSMNNPNEMNSEPRF